MRGKAKKRRPRLKRRPSARTIWSAAERAAWKLPDQLTVSEWAERYRVLDPRTSAEPGPWHNARTPYLVGIMDAFADPWVEDITIEASTQVGKTECLLNMSGYAIHQDPSPMLWVLPREKDVRSMSHNRFRPMLELSPALSELLPRYAEDLTKAEIHFDRMTLNFETAGTPAGLAARAIRYLFFDEIDKYSRFAGGEADPISLGTERTRTFWNRKRVRCSSPTTAEGFIHQAILTSTRERYWVPCPFCGEYQFFVFSQVKWPEGSTIAEIASGKLARYECKRCEKRIGDDHKQHMMTAGVWCPESSTVTRLGRIKGSPPLSHHRGFHIWAAYSPWLTWSDIAVEWLDSQGSLDRLRNFINSWLAECWEDRVARNEPDKIKLLARPYAPRTIPNGTICLTAGVDVQKDWFYYVVRAWGLAEESWLVGAGRLSSWEDVVRVVFNAWYPWESGQKDPEQIRLICLDSGYRTDEVYYISRQYAEFVRATKGATHLRGAPVTPSWIDKHPLTGKTMKVEEGGLTLWWVDTSFFKDKLNRMMHAEPNEPGQWHIHTETTEDYRKQLCAEQKVQSVNRKTGMRIEEWKVIPTGAPNHALDCEILNLVAAYKLEVQAWTEADLTPVVLEKPDETQQTDRAGGWVGGAMRGGGSSWLRG